MSARLHIKDDWLPLHENNEHSALIRFAERMLSGGFAPLYFMTPEQEKYILAAHEQILNTVLTRY
jgi:hypothetical protein